jgi:hypothetical protein
MNDLFNYDRLTPSRIRKLAEVIHNDHEMAREFAAVTVERLARLVPDSGMVQIERLEEAFVIALETRKIFDVAGLDLWSFFPREQPCSLLGHVFSCAVDGASLRDIVGAARSGSRGPNDELLFDAKENFGQEAGRASACA